MIKIAVIGTGGVGGYFGGRLALAGNDVTFIARGEQLQAIKEKGLRIKSVKGDFLVSPVHASDKISDIQKPDLVILGVKAWQVKDLATELKPFLKTDTIVLPLQNGVLAHEELLSVLNPENVIGGSCRIFCKVESPGVIAHYGVEPTINFGELDHTRTSRLVHLKSVFDESAITSNISNDIQTELWKKLMIIASGGLLAITRSNYGEVRELSETRELIHELLQEIYLVSVKAGVSIEPAFVGQTLSYIDTYAYEANTSLARDIWEGKPSEIEYQNGTVVRLGLKFGVETPVNKFIYHSILPMEAKARNRQKP
jgi:2-dehydropantoate 2-reductase